MVQQGTASIVDPDVALLNPMHREVHRRCKNGDENGENACQTHPVLGLTTIEISSVFPSVWRKVEKAQVQLQKEIGETLSTTKLRVVQILCPVFELRTRQVKSFLKSTSELKISFAPSQLPQV